MRRATVYDVAKKAGVSTATVSFTFRRPDKVKPSTRAKVLRAAKDLDYVPSANARGLARGNTGVLGLYSFDMLIERPAMRMISIHALAATMSCLRMGNQFSPIAQVRALIARVCCRTHCMWMKCSVDSSWNAGVAIVPCC